VGGRPPPSKIQRTTRSACWRRKIGCSAVDTPEPRRGAGADCRHQTQAGRKSKADQEACWRQDKNTEAGANEKVRSIEVDEERGQPERQRKQVSGTRHAPGYKLAAVGARREQALACGTHRVRTIRFKASRHFMTVGLGVLAPLTIWRMIPIPAPNRRWGEQIGQRRMRVNFRSKLGNQKLRFDRPESWYSVSKGRYPVEGRACRPTLFPCRSTINSSGCASKARRVSLGSPQSATRPRSIR
jgi:hypothetical protein